jgi:vacuolar-type H+-ATPase subunit H
MIFRKGRELMTKTPLKFMVLTVLALGLTACGDKTPSESARAAGDAVGDAAKTTGDAVRGAARTTGDAVGDAVQATGEFLNQPKDEFVKEAQERIAEIEQNWRALLAKTAPTTDKAKVELQDADKRMAEALATAKARLAEARDASDKDWQQNVKPSLDAALQKSQEIYEDVSARFGSR